MVCLPQIYTHHILFVVFFFFFHHSYKANVIWNESEKSKAYIIHSLIHSFNKF